MTKLIVQGSEIVAVWPWVELTEAFQAPSAVIPKSALSGWQIVDVELPDGFDGGKYTFDGTGVVSKAASVEELASARAERKAAATARRYEVETGGITVGGQRIETDREAQAMIAGAKLYADANPDALIDWKGANGWQQVDAATMTAIGQSLGSHIQACFSVERAHHEAIDALNDLAAIATYDVGAGWPSTA